MPCPPSRLPISLAFALITASAAAQSTPDEALIADIRDSVAHDLDAAELGPIYGAMVSITTAPEISAATYRVRDDEAPPTMRLYKLPLNWTLPSDDPDWAPYVQTSLGFTVQRAEKDQDIAQLRSDSLAALRDSVSGVSVEEELTKLQAFQRATEASVRVIQTVDSLLGNLIESV